jgi:hypothetical protein
MSKTINTKFLLRYDTWDNWSSKGQDLTLLAGEVAITAIENKSIQEPGKENATAVNTAPTILFKVGDGKTAFKNLPWASALAADVYAWAKEPTKPDYVATEIDYSKTITVKDDEGNVTGTSTETITTQAALDALYAAIDTLSGDAGESIADLLTKLGQVEEKVNKAYVKPDDGIALTDLAESVQTSLANADTALQAADISDLISKTAAAVTLETAETNEYAAAYVIKQGETTVGTINIPKDLVVKSGRVVTKENNTVIELTLANDEATKIEIPVDQLIEYVTTGSTATDNVIIDIDPITHQVTAALNDTLLTKINNAMDSTAVDTKINELDSTVEVSGPDADGRVSVLTKVVQTDGKLTDKAEVKLSKIATTGNINDLEQTNGDYIIFYGGDASGWSNPPTIE